MLVGVNELQLHVDPATNLLLRVEEVDVEHLEYALRILDASNSDLVDGGIPVLGRVGDRTVLECLPEAYGVEARQLLVERLQPKPQEPEVVLEGVPQVAELAPEEAFRTTHPEAPSPTLEIFTVVDREQRLGAHAAIVMTVAEHHHRRSPLALHDHVVVAADAHHHVVADVEVVMRTEGHQVGLLRGPLVLLELLQDPDSGPHLLAEFLGVHDQVLGAFDDRRDLVVPHLLEETRCVEGRLGRVAVHQATAGLDVVAVATGASTGVRAPPADVEGGRPAFAGLTRPVGRLQVVVPATVRDTRLGDGGILETLGHLLDVVTGLAFEKLLLLDEPLDPAGELLLAGATPADHRPDVLAPEEHDLLPSGDPGDRVLGVVEELLGTRSVGRKIQCRQFACHGTTLLVTV